MGEESHYVYNGLGYLVANEWVIEKNAYGYTNNGGASPEERVGGVVVCDRHANSTGQGHINPNGKGHTVGGTAGGSAPSIPGNMVVVHKDYALDYASALKNVLMETEKEAGIPKRASLTAQPAIQTAWGNESPMPHASYARVPRTHARR